jgi:hypothetical protein
MSSSAYEPDGTTSAAMPQELLNMDLIRLGGADVHSFNVTAVGRDAGCRYRTDAAKVDRCSLHRVT